MTVEFYMLVEISTFFCPFRTLFINAYFSLQGKYCFLYSNSCKEGNGLTRNKVEICGVDTSKLPVLKNEEMRLLFKRVQQEGDISAREKLVNGNLRLVLSVIQTL